MNKLFTICLLLINAFVNAQAPAIEWQKSLGGSGDDYPKAMQQTNDGGYIVAGSSNSIDGDVTGNHGGLDCWIVKLNSTGNIEWQKCLGGSSFDLANAIQQTADGGYIVAGKSVSKDGDAIGRTESGDFWIVKLNSTGNIEWQKGFGGSGFETANTIQQTTNGGYIVAGLSTSNDGDVTGNHGGRADAWVVKLNSTGNIEWQKCLGGSSYDYASAIQQTKDDGYIVAGYSDSNDGDVTGNHGGNGDCWVVKLNSTGNIEWQKSLGGSLSDEAYAVKETKDGGYIVAGYSSSSDGDVTGGYGAYDYWVVKLNSAGNIEWQKGLRSGLDNFAYSIQQTTDDGYIVSGYSSHSDDDVTGFHFSDDYYIVKLNSTGNIEWQKRLGGSGEDRPFATIQQTTDGGYIVAGYSLSVDGDVTGNHGRADYWVVKLGASALPLNLLHFDAVKNKTNVQVNWQTTNEINTSHFIVQRSASGTNFNNIGRVEAKNTSSTHDYSLTDASPVEGVNFYRLQMVDIDGKTTYNPIIKIVFTGKNELQVFPNPAKNIITVSGLQNKGTIRIIAADGKAVKQLSTKAGNMLVDIGTLAKGIYILQYSNENKTEQIKIIKQ